MKCNKNLTTNRSAANPNGLVAGRADTWIDSTSPEGIRHPCSGEHGFALPHSEKSSLMVCLLIVLIASSITESFSWAGETNRIDRLAKSYGQSSDSKPISRQWPEIETEISLANSGIDNFVRMEENHRIRPTLTKMIESEKILLAMRASTESLKKAPKNIEVDSDAIAMDPVFESMHVAKAELATAYRKIDESSDELLLTQRSISRLSWDTAQMSSLPGLVRLVALRDNDLMVPIYVSRISVDDSNLSNQTVDVVVVTEYPNTAVDDSPALQSIEAEDLVETFVTEPESQVDVESFTPNATRQDESGLATIEMPGDEIQTPSNPAPSNTLQESRSSNQPNNAATTEKRDSESIEAAVADLSPAPIIIQPRPIIQKVMTQPVMAQPIVTNHPPAEPTPPAAHVAANWPFVDGKQNTEKVSLNVSNADVRTVFEMLARGYQMNILVSPNVTGTVTANIEGLTAEETLNGVLKMCDLKSRREEGLIFIYPGDGMPAESREVRLFPLDFARADVLDPAVQGLLSPIGSAYVTQMNDQDNLRTNETIVVVDTPEAISQIEEYILQADRAPRQVMIEAHILEVILKDDMMHGINLDAIIGGDITVGSFGLADPIASRTNPLVFAQVDGSRVDALIDLIETTTDSKTLASPRIMVVNGQNARIQVGQQLGFTVATVTQTSTIQDVQFLDTGVVLSVTPTISRNDMIMLQVKPEVSDGQINPDTLLPEEETREVETSVLLDNHRGVVIGGLIQETDRTVIRKLPWLGDVKHVGKLFQRREIERERSEIIVALVPHIIECGPATERDAVDYDRATSPLLHGPLKRNCRPWEPRLPDTVGQERHLDVNRVNEVITP